MNCYYCDKEGELKVRKGDNGAPQDIHCCTMHWKILNDPKTAIPFLRGVFAVQIRTSSSDLDADRKAADDLINAMSKWKKRTTN